MCLGVEKDGRPQGGRSSAFEGRAGGGARNRVGEVCQLVTCERALCRRWRGVNRAVNRNAALGVAGRLAARAEIKEGTLGAEALTETIGE